MFTCRRRSARGRTASSSSWNTLTSSHRCARSCAVVIFLSRPHQHVQCCTWCASAHAARYRLCVKDAYRRTTLSDSRPMISCVEPDALPPAAEEGEGRAAAAAPAAHDAGQRRHPRLLAAPRQVLFPPRCTRSETTETTKACSSHLTHLTRGDSAAAAKSLGPMHAPYDGRSYAPHRTLAHLNVSQSTIQLTMRQFLNERVVKPFPYLTAACRRCSTCGRRS